MIAARKPNIDLHPLAPWLRAIAELCLRQWSDGLIAEALSKLTLPAVMLLHDTGWQKARVEEVIEECMAGKHGGKRRVFTRQNVKDYRRRLSMRRAAVRVKAESMSLVQRRRQYQVEKGWGHLLPDHPLTPRQCNILSALRDGGSGTKAQIADAIGETGRKPMMSQGRSDIVRLLVMGLLQSSHSSICAPRAMLSIHPDALLSSEPRRETSVDAKYG